MTEHVRSWIYLTISELTWAKLSAEDQAAVMQAAKMAQEYERQMFIADEKELVGELESKGMTFVKVDSQAFASQAKEQFWLTSSLKFAL